MSKNWIFRLSLVSILLLSKSLFAQTDVPLTSEEITKLVNPDQKKWRNLFVNVGGEFVDDYAINSVLFAQDVPVIPTNLFYLGVGFSYRNQEFKDTFEVELGFNLATSEEEEFNYGNNYNEVQFQLRYERRFLDVKSAFFSAGLQAKYLFANLDIYPIETSVNIDELTTSANNTSIQNQALFLGPSFSFNWINPNSDRLMLRVILNYDFNLYNTDWEAQYGTTINSFNEDASRSSIRLLIPLYF
ncbi:hypothetical protein [Psychroflexus planctonicus]|uniref:Outer membrane protein beta-barrel domain-containing protein n=1 Tax=Psychroflexus planctonicus TaxID=1526575 RepID=A0ABQ1SDX0_9FLAO|nr:hypothetical protein [Psychroflexus planctonicus]GGE25799.1 hypothetical protein GCM10010832_03180 [Psychroflexus planctonicus]